MKVDKYVAKNVVLRSQVSGFDSTHEWETLNPSSFHWPNPYYQARAQSTVADWDNLGDRGDSNVPRLFWNKDDALDDG